jgi:hypothetical protein
MQVDPPDADPPKRKRRWFQFSLRTLLIVVTLLCVACGYVGWQAKIVRDRRELLDSSKPAEWSQTDDENLSWLQRKLGDQGYKRIYLAKSVSPELIERFREPFPEALIEQFDSIVGKWLCDYAGLKNGYAVVFFPDREVCMGINLQRPPFEPAAAKLRQRLEFRDRVAAGFVQLIGIRRLRGDAWTD